MAVPEQTPYKEYTANGVTKIFPLEFDVLEKDHLIVLVNDSEPSVGSWSLDAVNDTVVFVKAPANGVNVKIRRDTPLERSTDYKTYNASFNPPSVNADFDNIWRKLQEMGVLNWLSNNNIKDLNEYVDSLNGETKEQFLAMIEKQGVSLNQLDDYYNYILGKLATISSDKDWDASFIAYNEKFTQQKINNGFESVAEMLAIINPKNGTRVYLKSYYKSTNFALSTPYKGGNRHFTFDSTKALINNRGTIINGWVSEEIIEHTPEMWGAYGDNEHFDDEAINNMFRTLQPYPTGSNCKISDIRNLLDNCKKYTVRLLSAYRTRKTIYIPCGITLIQPIESRWTINLGVGFDYEPEPSDYNTAAVATVAYQYNNDHEVVQQGTYTQVTDVMFTPTAQDFDSAKFITLGWHVDLQGLAVFTNPNVTLGIFFNGFFGKTDGLSIGSGLSPRVPKVGMVTNLGWNAEHSYTFVQSSVQGAVFHGVCTWNTLYNPLINRRGGAVQTTSTEAIYDHQDIQTTGTIAITNIGAITHVVSPCYQSWVLGIVNVGGGIFTSLSTGAYHESLLCKHEFYNIASTLNITLSGYFGGYFYGDEITDLDGSKVDHRRSALHVDKMGDGSKFSCSISGDARFGIWRWVTGHSSRSYRCISLNIDGALDAVSWGRIGDMHLISNLGAIPEKFTRLYVDPDNGDDDNFGLSKSRPLKTLKNLSDWNRLGLQEVELLKPSGMGVGDAAIDLFGDCSFFGSTLSTTGGGRFASSGKASITFNCAINGSGNPYAIVYLKDSSETRLRFLNTVAVDGAVCRSLGNSVLDVEAVTSEFRVSSYVDVAPGFFCSIGIIQEFPQAEPPIGSGTIFVRYKL